MRNIASYFYIIYYIFLRKEVFIYKISPRFGQAASGIPIVLHELKKYGKIKNFFFIETNRYIFFNQYLEELKYKVIPNNRLVNILYNYSLKYKINSLNRFSTSYFLNEVKLFKNSNLDQKLIDNILYKNIDINFLSFLKNKFICISIKEKSYYESNFFFSNYIQPEHEFDTVDRLETSVNYLIDLGYNVIRVGRNLKPSKIMHQNFFDYASSSFQSDYCDVLLAKNTEFVISNQTGFDMLAAYWFEKSIYQYQIRSYRFLIETHPFKMFNPIIARKKGKKISFIECLMYESELWTSNNPNDLYDSLNKEYITYEQYSDLEIKESFKVFYEDYYNKYVFTDDKLISDFWSTFNYYINPIYLRCNRPLGNQNNYNKPNINYLP